MHSQDSKNPQRTGRRPDRGGPPTSPSFSQPPTGRGTHVPPPASSPGTVRLGDGTLATAASKPSPGGFTPRSEVSEVAPAAFDSAPPAAPKVADSPGRAALDAASPNPGRAPAQKSETKAERKAREKAERASGSPAASDDAAAAPAPRTGLAPMAGQG